MKQWITLSISAAMMFASCKKENLANSNTLNANGPAISARSADGSTYASGWEQSSSWNHYDSAAFRIYYMDRSTPEITAAGSRKSTSGNTRSLSTWATVMACIAAPVP